MQQKVQRTISTFFSQATVGAFFTTGLVSASWAGTLDQSNFRIHYVDSEETVAEYHPAEHAIDGRAKSWWFAQWTGVVEPFPHKIQIDMGDLYNVNGLRYLPRQDRSHGRVKDYKLFVSMDGEDWGSAVASGRFANTKSEQEVRFNALSEVQGNGFASAAEINILGATFDGNVVSSNSTSSDPSLESFSEVFVTSASASEPETSSEPQTETGSAETTSSSTSSTSSSSGVNNDPVNWQRLVSDASNVYRVSSESDLNNRIENAKPGDAILIRSGTYSSWNVKITSKGNRDNPIIIAAEDAGKVTFTGGTRFIVSGSHNIIGGLRFSNADLQEVIRFDGADRNRFTDNVFEDCGAGRYMRVVGIKNGSDHNRFDHNLMKRTLGISMVVVLPRDGSGGTYSQYNQFDHNEFRDINVNGKVETGHASIQVGAYANDHEDGDSFTTIANNKFINIKAINVINSKSNSEYYYNNEFRDIDQVALALRSGNDKIVDGNEFYNTSIAVRVIGTGAKVINNLIVDSEIGIQIPAYGDYQTLSGKISPSGPTGNILIANNTVVNSSNIGLELGRIWGFVNTPGYVVADAPPFDVRIINNLFSSGNGILLRKRTAIDETIHRNLFHAIGSADAGTTGLEAVTGNPNLDSQYKPSTSGIAVDKGVTLSEVEDDLRNRVRRPNFDLGAFEVK